MTHREQLEQLRADTIKRHKETLKGIDALISLADKETGMFSEPVVNIFKSAASTDSFTPIFTKPALGWGSLEDGIYQLMETMQDTYFSAEKAWSARDIYLMLRSRDYPFTQDEDAAINTVSGVLIRMNDRGVLGRPVKGSGRSPSRYTWIRAEHRPVTTARAYVYPAGWAAAASALVDPANVYGGGLHLYDATTKGGPLGSMPGTTESFDQFARRSQKEEEASEETS